jgi:hypothetical protein
MAALRSMPEAGEISAMVDRFIVMFGHLSESGNDFSHVKWEEDGETLFRMIMSAEGQDRKRELYTIDSLKDRKKRVPASLRKAYLRAGRFKFTGNR